MQIACLSRSIRGRPGATLSIWAGVRTPLVSRPQFFLRVQDHCPSRVDISHQLAPLWIAIRVIPHRELKIARSELALGNRMEIDPQSSEQGQSFGERHTRISQVEQLFV